jgi:hypothetical protein
MKTVLKFILSPFLIVTGILVVSLYYLSFFIGVELSVTVLTTFFVLAVSYMILAFVTKFFFRFFVNSISLKLIGFYITTTFVPIILLAIILSVAVFFAIGVSQSYFLTKAINFNYNSTFKTKNKDTKFLVDNEKIYFLNKEQNKQVELNKDFFENLKNYLNFNFAVYIINLQTNNKNPNNTDFFENISVNIANSNTNIHKIYTSENKIKLTKHSLNNLNVNLFDVTYPVVFKAGNNLIENSVIFVMHINTATLIKDIFFGKSSASEFNKLVIEVFFVLALALFAFQVYLFFRGIYYMSTISSSASLLKKGAMEIEKGNFDYRIGKLEDRQLDEIRQSFNSMAKNIKNLIEELVEKKQLEHEFQIARKIQESALSVGFHNEKEINLAVFSEPSKEVGGDYFNFIKREDGMTVLAGDVSGKGLGAAMYVSEINGLFSAMVSKGGSGLEIAESLHRFFIKRGEKKIFFTATLLEFDFKSKIIHYFRLGDPPLIIRDKNGVWSILKPQGIPAGMRGVSDFKKYITPKTINTDNIDIIFLFSDGFFEVMNSNEKEIINFLDKCYRQDVKKFYENIQNLPNYNKTDKNMLDDITFAIIKPS